uniref:Uncharacterized protein n=1 Tax=Candidatus Kentrum sp. TUN TaxID=2126343 RepID=A0A450Z9Q2_9GAMM|nr:MAG: hypothetical protein BECKTUN1418E_GA0071001_100336 [Candidatus Kentron sp. TUN]VFK51737.1 MAG: hypothetical protein BECKTUN1418F_GA0071002_100336 [Candidatus Kentron sp. TUN]
MTTLRGRAVLRLFLMDLKENRDWERLVTTPVFLWKAKIKKFMSFRAQQGIFYLGKNPRCVKFLPLVEMTYMGVAK